MKRVKDIPQEDRPRERLIKQGPASLSDAELIAVLMGSGTEKRDVFTIAERVLEAVDRTSGNPSIKDLCEIDGVGPAKATLISAVLEFGRRRIKPEGLKITFAADVLPLIMNYADRKQEHLLSITLNGASEVMSVRVLSIGLVNRSQVHPRMVFADAITDRAAAIVIAHNHPSGPLTPSKEDVEVTQRLKAAGEILGMRLVDHVIFNKKTYYSLLGTWRIVALFTYE
jgi:DNA repair protein RadC